MVMPLNLMEKSMNRRLSLLLKDGRQLEGKLVGFDEYMNMVLDDTEETIRVHRKPGEVEGKEKGEGKEKESTGPEVKVRRLGTVILRGNNVVTISPR